MFIQRWRLSLTSTSRLMRPRDWLTSEFTTRSPQVTSIDTLQSLSPTSMCTSSTGLTPTTLPMISSSKYMPTTAIWLTCTLVRSAHKTLTRSATFQLTSIRSSQSGTKTSTLTTCSLTSITDGESPHAHGSHRLRRLTSMMHSRRDLMLTITIMIREVNLMLSGLRNKSSLT